MHDHAAHAPTEPSTPGRADLRSPLALTLFALIVSGRFLLDPTALHLPACSEPWDAPIYPWNFFWLRASTGASDGSLLFTQRLFWPAGEGLGLYTPTWIYGLIAWPVTTIAAWFVGPGLAGNVAVAVLLAFSSVATALLAWRFARALGLGNAAALFAAALVTVASGRTMNVARLNLFCTEFLLLYAILALNLWRSGLWRDGQQLRGAALGLVTSLLFLQSQPLCFQAFLATLLFGLAALCRRATRQRLFALTKPLLTALTVFALLAGPFVWELLRELKASPAIGQAAALSIPGSLDPASLLLPNDGDRFAALFHDWLGLPLRDARLSFFEFGGPHGTVSHFLGLGFTLLIALGVTTKGARRAFGFGLALLVIACGPVLHWRGALLPVPLPYALLGYVPALSIEKSPTRFLWLAQLCFAFAAAKGVERLAATFQAGGTMRRFVGPIAAAALALLTLIEQSDTVPLRSIEPAIAIPPEIAALADDPSFKAVLDLPYDGRPPSGAQSHAVSALAMGFGAAHQKALFFGLYPRASRTGEAELAARPLFALIHRCEQSARDGAPNDSFNAAELAAAQADLAALEIGAVLLHEVAIDPPRYPGVNGQPGEHARLLALLRALQPKSEQRLAAGAGDTITLFRF